MVGDNALEYAHFFDFSKSDSEPELVRMLLEEENETEENFSNVGELVLPSGAVIGTIIFPN